MAMGVGSALAICLSPLPKKVIMSPTLSTPIVHYAINMIRDEARHLVDTGCIARQQPLYVLCQYIPAREWEVVEQELEDNGYLLRDRVSDLLGRVII